MNVIVILKSELEYLLSRPKLTISSVMLVQRVTWLEMLMEIAA